MFDEVILSCLQETNDLLDRQAPKTKSVTRTKDISNIAPYELSEFLKENKIPEDCHFNYFDDTYIGEVTVCWKEYVESNTEEVEDYKTMRFSQVLYSLVNKALKDIGYQRVGVNSSHFRKYLYTTFYDKFLEGDFEYFIEYYSKLYEKVEEVK